MGTTANLSEPSSVNNPPSHAPEVSDLAENRIVMDRVSVEYDDRRVLDDISLTLSEQRIAIIGLNGSGKSTLVRLINGLVMPTYGRVTVGGACTMKETKQVRRRVGFVFQNPANQIIMPTVGEDMLFGLKNIGIPKAERVERARATLAQLGMGNFYERETHALSGGEQQMIALASVLTMRPETIILDEPTTMLDLLNRHRMRSVIAGLAQRSIVVTHDLELAADAQRVLVVHEGRIVEDGSPEDSIAAYRRMCEL